VLLIIFGIFGKVGFKDFYYFEKLFVLDLVVGLVEVGKLSDTFEIDCLLYFCGLV
jgi:hypothetical protein